MAATSAERGRRHRERKKEQAEINLRDSLEHIEGEPNTVKHFDRWARQCVLDSGDFWEPEDFQLAVVEDVLGGNPITWEIVPEGNGKTTLFAGLALYHLDPIGAGQNAPFVVVAAAAKEQAEWLYQQAEGFVLDTPGMSDRFRCLGGFRRINRANGLGRGRIQIFAADDKTADGAIFTLALIDELHNHRDLRLYRRWVGKRRKRGGQIAVISTAGEPGSDFEDTRNKILKDAEKVTQDGPYVRAEGGGVVLHDWAVRERVKAADMEAVAEANPLSTITPEFLLEKRADPTMTDEHWLRFTCNIATRIEGVAIHPEDWDGLADPKLKPALPNWCVGWLDLGWKIDTTAMGVLIWESAERRVIHGVNVLESPVDEADVVAGMVAIQRKYKPRTWVYDPNAGGQQMAQLLGKGEHPKQGDTAFDFTEHSQDPMPMALAAARFDEAIRAGWIVHDGDETLRRHALNTVKKPVGSSGEKWRYDRPPSAKGERRAKFPIDALTGVVMGHSVAVAEHEQPDAVPLVAARPRK